MKRLFNGSKLCPRCGNWKPTNAYGKDQSRIDGLHGHCKVCRRTYRLARKPIPTIAFHVNSMDPRRFHVPEDRWAEFDLLVDGGYAVSIIRPDGTIIDWSEIV